MKKLSILAVFLSALLLAGCNSNPTPEVVNEPVVENVEQNTEESSVVIPEKQEENSETTTTSELKKTLVLYFSVYKSTKAFAEEIAKQTKADIVEIEPAVPYDGDSAHYDELAKYAKNEQDEGARPAIKNQINIQDYDTIFVGYPIWWYTMPMIIYTLFDEYDFSGKTIIPFNTHEGSRDGGTYKTIQDLEPNAEVLDGLPIRGGDVANGVETQVKEWLSDLNIID